MPGLKYKFNRVMLIDDNPIDLYIAGKMIAKHLFAHKVLPYDSAITALAFLEQHQNQPAVLPEIILVDIHMPEMSGFDFLDAYCLLGSALKNHCRVYVVSSSIDEHDIMLVNQNKNVAGFGVKTISTSFLDSIAQDSE